MTIGGGYISPLDIKHGDVSSMLRRMRMLLSSASGGTWEWAEACSYQNGKPHVDEVFVRLEDGDIAIYADVANPNTGKPDYDNAEFAVQAHNFMVPTLLNIADAAALVVETRAQLALFSYSEHDNPELEYEDLVQRLGEYNDALSLLVMPYLDITKGYGRQC